MDLTCLKLSIDQNLPSNRGELIYIYQHLGNVLFKDKWHLYSNTYYPISDAVDCKIIYGMIKVCDMLRDSNKMSEKQYSDLINYIFQQSLIKLENF